MPVGFPKGFVDFIVVEQREHGTEPCFVDIALEPTFRMPQCQDNGLAYELPVVTAVVLPP